MGMTNCKDCGNQISEKAEFCPKCGAKPKKRKYLKWLAILILLPAMMMTILNTHEREATTASSTVAEKKLSKQEEMELAQSACEDFVVKSLDDPKSADMDFFKKYVIKEEAAGQFKVNVTGRARNGFNAIRRFAAICKIRHKEDGNWQILAIQQVNN